MNHAFDITSIDFISIPLLAYCSPGIVGTEAIKCDARILMQREDDNEPPSEFEFDTILRSVEVPTESTETKLLNVYPQCANHLMLWSYLVVPPSQSTF